MKHQNNERCANKTHKQNTKQKSQYTIQTPAFFLIPFLLITPFSSSHAKIVLNEVIHQANGETYLEVKNISQNKTIDLSQSDIRAFIPCYQCTESYDFNDASELMCDTGSKLAPGDIQMIKGPHIDKLPRIIFSDTADLSTYTTYTFGYSSSKEFSDFEPGYLPSPPQGGSVALKGKRQSFDSWAISNVPTPCTKNDVSIPERPRINIEGENPSSATLFSIKTPELLFPNNTSAISNTSAKNTSDNRFIQFFEGSEASYNFEVAEAGSYDLYLKETATKPNTFVAPLYSVYVNDRRVTSNVGTVSLWRYNTLLWGQRKIVTLDLKAGTHYVSIKDVKPNPYTGSSVNFLIDKLFLIRN